MKKDIKQTSKNLTPNAKELTVFADDRGIFVPFTAIDDLPHKIKRIYYVYNSMQGTIRGFHFHKEEWKYFTILSGSAKFVAIDPKNTKEIHTFYSSTRKPTLVTIPPGFANGWMSLENGTILLCASTATLEESIKDDIRFDPHKWGDVWSVVSR